ncbi:hypothetical protein D3C86_1277130 [compost metagenome]
MGLELLDRLEAIVGVRREHLADDPLDLRVDRLVERADVRQVEAGLLVGPVALGGVAGEQVVPEGAQGVDVRALIDLARQVAELLGRRVAGRRVGGRRAGQDGRAVEAREADPLGVGGDDHVARLQIQVQDLPAVELADGLAQLDHPVQGLLDGDGGAVAQKVGEVAAFELLDHQVGALVRLEDVEGLDHGRVRDRAQDEELVLPGVVPGLLRPLALGQGAGAVLVLLLLDDHHEARGLVDRPVEVGAVLVLEEALDHVAVGEQGLGAERRERTGGGAAVGTRRGHGSWLLS